MTSPDARKIDTTHFERVSPELARFYESARSAGVDVDLLAYSEVEDSDPSYALMLRLPNGRESRPSVVTDRSVAKFAALPLGSLTWLGGYEAIYDRSDGSIYAVITSRLLPPHTLSSRLWKRQHKTDVEANEPEIDELIDEREDYAPDPVMEVASGDGVVIRLGPSITHPLFLRMRGLGLRISGVGSLSHDEALQRLESIGGSFLFDLDLTHNVSLQIARERARPPRQRAHAASGEARYPVSPYAAPALQLYRYGREANGLPLLEFLAYYQTLEYFFPYFSREQVVLSVRSALADPRFSSRNDNDVNRIISLASFGGTGHISERDQLRATVRAGFSGEELRELIVSVDEAGTHFARKGPIKGVPQLVLDGSQTDLRDQVADRIYAIRCRIVHAKQDSGADTEVILPFSREASSLGPEVELVRVVAQKVIIARAARS